jgi:hypothetical protein
MELLAFLCVPVLIQILGSRGPRYSSMREAANTPCGVFGVLGRGLSSILVWAIMIGLFLTILGWIWDFFCYIWRLISNFIVAITKFLLSDPILIFFSAVILIISLLICLYKLNRLGALKTIRHKFNLLVRTRNKSSNSIAVDADPREPFQFYISDDPFIPVPSREPFEPYCLVDDVEGLRRTLEASRWEELRQELRKLRWSDLLESDIRIREYKEKLQSTIDLLITKKKNIEASLIKKKKLLKDLCSEWNELYTEWVTSMKNGYNSDWEIGQYRAGAERARERWMQQKEQMPKRADYAEIDERKIASIKKDAFSQFRQLQSKWKRLEKELVRLRKEEEVDSVTVSFNKREMLQKKVAILFNEEQELERQLIGRISDWETTIDKMNHEDKETLFMVERVAQEVKEAYEEIGHERTIKWKIALDYSTSKRQSETEKAVSNAIRAMTRGYKPRSR